MVTDREDPRKERDNPESNWESDKNLEGKKGQIRTDEPQIGKPPPSYWPMTGVDRVQTTLTSLDAPIAISEC